MKTRYWTFGKLLLAYTLFEFILRMRQFDLENRIEWESGIANCRFWIHQPIEAYLFPAALILILNRRHLNPYALIPGGLALYWATFDFYLVFQAELRSWMEGSFSQTIHFWLSDWGPRSFFRLVAAVLTVSFCTRGLWRYRGLLWRRIEPVTWFEPVRDVKFEVAKTVFVSYLIVLTFLMIGETGGWIRQFEEMVGIPGREMDFFFPLFRLWLEPVVMLGACVLLNVPGPWALFLAEVSGLSLILLIGFRFFEFFQFCLSQRFSQNFDPEFFRHWFFLNPGGIQVFPILAAAVFILTYASGEFSRFFRLSVREAEQ